MLLLCFYWLLFIFEVVCLPPKFVMVVCWITFSFSLPGTYANLMYSSGSSEMGGLPSKNPSSTVTLSSSQKIKDPPSQHLHQMLGRKRSVVLVLTPRSWEMNALWNMVKLHVQNGLRLTLNVFVQKALMFDDRGDIQLDGKWVFIQFCRTNNLL